MITLSGDKITASTYAQIIAHDTAVKAIYPEDPYHEGYAFEFSELTLAEQKRIAAAFFTKRKRIIKALDKEFSRMIKVARRAKEGC